MFTFILYHIIYSVSIDLHCSVCVAFPYYEQLNMFLFSLNEELTKHMLELQLRHTANFSWAKIFFLSTVIITKNPTRGRVNVTVIEVALQEQDDGIHQEYKVFFVCIYDEASYKQPRYPVFYIWVFFFGLYLQVKHPLQLKARILRKVELFLELETSLIIFS